MGLLHDITGVKFVEDALLGGRTIVNNLRHNDWFLQWLHIVHDGLHEVLAELLGDGLLHLLVIVQLNVYHSC